MHAKADIMQADNKVVNTNMNLPKPAYLSSTEELTSIFNNNIESNIEQTKLGVRTQKTLVWGQSRSPFLVTPRCASATTTATAGTASPFSPLTASAYAVRDSSDSSGEFVCPVVFDSTHTQPGASADAYTVKEMIVQDIKSKARVSTAAARASHQVTPVPVQQPRVTDATRLFPFPRITVDNTHHDHGYCDEEEMEGMGEGGADSTGLLDRGRSSSVCSPSYAPLSLTFGRGNGTGTGSGESPRAPPTPPMAIRAMVSPVNVLRAEHDRAHERIVQQKLAFDVVAVNAAAAPVPPPKLVRPRLMAPGGKTLQLFLPNQSTPLCATGNGVSTEGMGSAQALFSPPGVTAGIAMYSPRRSAPEPDSPGASPRLDIDSASLYLLPGRGRDNTLRSPSPALGTKRALPVHKDHYVQPFPVFSFARDQTGFELARAGIGADNGAGAAFNNTEDTGYASTSTLNSEADHRKELFPGSSAMDAQAGSCLGSNGANIGLGMGLGSAFNTSKPTKRQRCDTFDAKKSDATRDRTLENSTAAAVTIATATTTADTANETDKDWTNSSDPDPPPSSEKKKQPEEEEDYALGLALSASSTFGSVDFYLDPAGTGSVCERRTRGTSSNSNDDKEHDSDGEGAMSEENEAHSEDDGASPRSDCSVDTTDGEQWQMDM